MKQKLLFLLAIILLLSMSHLNSQVRITEVMSGAGGTGVGDKDWFEITNLGSTAVDITGWKVDDSSFAPASALALNGVTSIPAGKSVIFMETATPTTDIPALKAFWGSSMDNVAVGSYTGSGIGLSGTSGDGVILFDNTATAPVEVTRLSFPAATTGSSFYWTYNASGVMLSTATGIVSTVGTINGTISNQVTLTSANSLGVYNIGSPGTAVVYPLGAGVNSPYYKNWFISGNKLKFDVMPTTDIEIFALTGSKLAVYDAVKEIELKLNKGIYMLRVDNKAYKFMISK
jgi:hypothetical protein